ncbi:MAG: hypothetical protein L0Z07_03120, partial [Planctomycetes bacterium]|nr:hypothetical protein [Planctomycetota bacterium]
VYWSADAPDWEKRKWVALPATKADDETYEAQLPPEAAGGAHWFALVSDDRPVTVSGRLVGIVGTPKPASAVPGSSGGRRPETPSAGVVNLLSLQFHEPGTYP